MKEFIRILQFALLLGIFSSISGVLAAKPSSFCKCTCFSNSTIIELSPVNIDKDYSNALTRRTTEWSLDERAPATETEDDDKTNNSDNKDTTTHGRSLNCNDCNRKLCLDYNLPKCKGAKEDDVIATCFQRDSRKDQAVVIIFILATSGLLTWAVFRPWVQGWIEAVRERQSYIPVSHGGADQ